MKTIISICLISASCMAALGPHPVERTRMSENALAVQYRDKMSDGTFRDSELPKPKMPEFPARIELTATNEAAAFWELVYVAHFDGGLVTTNYTSVLKDKRDMLAERLVMPEPPEPSTNAPAKLAAMALAKERMLESVTTNRVARMGKRIPRALNSRIENGRIVQTMTNGSVRTNDLKTAHTARVNAQSPNPIEVPEPTGKSATFLLGFAAGVAAMGGIVVAKKGKG